MVKIMSLKQFEKPFAGFLEEGFEFDRSFTAQQKLGKDVTVKHTLAWNQRKGISKMSFNTNKISLMTSGKVDIDQNGKLSSFEVGGKTPSLLSVALRGNETNRTQVAISGEVYKLKLSGDVDIVDLSSGSASILRNESKVSGSINVTKKQGSIALQHRFSNHHIILIGFDYGGSGALNASADKASTDTTILPEMPKTASSNENTVKLSFGHEFYNQPSTSSSRKANPAMSYSVQAVSSKTQHYFSPNSLELCTYHYGTGYFGGLLMKQASPSMGRLEKSVAFESTIGWAAKALSKETDSTATSTTVENDSEQDTASTNNDDIGDGSSEVKNKKNKDKRSAVNGLLSQVALTLRSQSITPHGLDLFLIHSQVNSPLMHTTYCGKVSMDVTKKQLGGDIVCQLRRVDPDNKKNSWKLKTRIKSPTSSSVVSSKVAISVRREQQLSSSEGNGVENGGSCWLRMAVELPIGLIASNSSTFTKDVRVGFGVGVCS